MTSFEFIIALLAVVSFPFHWGFYISMAAKFVVVYGTRARYAFATIAWFCLPFSWIFTATFAITSETTWKWVLSVVVEVMMTMYLFRDDDDNYWRRKRKQFMKWARGIRIHQPAVGHV